MSGQTIYKPNLMSGQTIYKPSLYEWPNHLEAALSFITVIHVLPLILPFFFFWYHFFFQIVSLLLPFFVLVFSSRFVCMYCRVPSVCEPWDVIPGAGDWKAFFVMHICSFGWSSLVWREIYAEKFRPFDGSPPCINCQEDHSREAGTWQERGKPKVLQNMRIDNLERAHCKELISWDFLILLW